MELGKPFLYNKITFPGGPTIFKCLDSSSSPLHGIIAIPLLFVMVSTTYLPKFPVEAPKITNFFSA